MHLPIRILAQGPRVQVGETVIKISPRAGLRLAEQLVTASMRSLIDEVAREQRTVRATSRGAKR